MCPLNSVNVEIVPNKDDQGLPILHYDSKRNNLSSTQTIAQSRNLVSGFGAYTTEIELQFAQDAQAPAITPATPPVLSFIATSTVGCGVAASVIGGSAVGSIASGC